ncbi:PA14 domain-containing protein, partial [Verrucomicrobiota bacterium]
PAKCGFYRLNVKLANAGAPLANAGPDQDLRDDNTNGTEIVTLNGAGSMDPDGDTLTYSWSTNGVEFATGPSPSVVLPVGTHLIRLTVRDGVHGSDTDTVKIYIERVYAYGPPGLKYDYYEVSGTSVPNFDSLTPVTSGTTDNFGIDVRERDSNYALRFRGMIEISSAGSYTFYTTSDDGSLLWIGSTLVVNNDGGHGMQERSGTITLQAGLHPITVGFAQGGGGHGLEVRYEAPGITKALIPDDVLFQGTD